MTAIKILRFYYGIFSNYSNIHPVVRLENIYTEAVTSSVDSPEDTRTSLGSDKRTSIYYSKSSENTTSYGSDEGSIESSKREKNAPQPHQFEFYKGTVKDVCNLCYLPLDYGFKCVVCSEIIHDKCHSSSSQLCKERKKVEDLARPITAIDFINDETGDKSIADSADEAETAADTQQIMLNNVKNSLMEKQEGHYIVDLFDKEADMNKEATFLYRYKSTVDSFQQEDDTDLQERRTTYIDIGEDSDVVSKNDTIFRRINEVGSSKVVPRRLKNALKSKPSVINDWVVPLDAVTIGETIKMSRFGSVKEGKWHGIVSVIMLNKTDMTHVEEITFRQKIILLRRTRHTNLGLFMGAILENPVYGIITSLIQGDSIHDKLQKEDTNVDHNYGISVIQQVAQGLGYLHSRGIIHNNLNCKTVTLEGEVVKLTEFGLVTKDNQSNYLKIVSNRMLIPKYWLVYQPPEVLNLLSPTGCGDEFEALTNKSDIYCLGIMWKEILDKNFMIGTRYPDCYIYRICSSMYLDDTPITGDMKLVMTVLACLQYNPEDRPNSGSLIEMLQYIPKPKPVVKAISAPIKPGSFKK